MGDWHYAYGGLNIVSQLQLPEWDSYAHPQTHDTPDVWISCAADCPASLEHSELISTDERCYFVVPTVASYEVRSGNTIHVRPARGAGWREMRLFLLGTAWAALLYQRGLLPLHAAVVRLGNGAVAFCGPSGAGKSTVAAWLLQHGYSLVSDDLCLCEISAHGPALVWPSTPRIKLWDDTLALFGHSSDGLERDHYRHAKFLLPWTTEHGVEPLPLTAIYILRWGEPQIVRLRGTVALQRLVTDGTYRPELLQTTTQVFAQWQRCAQLARRTEIWEWSRPREAARLDEVMGMLVQGR